MKTKELELILNGIYYLNSQEINLIENSMLRNIILENEEINRETKKKLINKFLINFTESSRFIEDEINEKIEKRLEEILKIYKNMKQINE